ncbi:EF-hand domain-containing protein [Luteolibacter sp. Populi]|uniref:EF-hand domain-containing protein n=1 Tax=Luteolibacter sp. Populi TaxID=3230487 RepID=UPI0034650056
MIAARYSWLALLTLATAPAEEMKPEDKAPPSPAPQQDSDKPPGGPKGPRGKDKDGMRRMMEAWKKADTDGDGFISTVEFAAMERPGRLSEEKRNELFKRFDKDGDGRIGPGEMPKQRGPGGMPPLDQADANKDGKIDFAEFKTLEWVKRLPEERQQGMFKRMDSDGDGFLTAKDRREGARDGRDGKGGRRNLLDLVRDHDKDANGSLNFAEFREIPWVKNDGEDKQEERFNELDKNKDLKLDATDLPPPSEKPDRPKDEAKKKQAEEA